MSEKTVSEKTVSETTVSDATMLEATMPETAMSETTVSEMNASEAMTMNLSGDGKRESGVVDALAGEKASPEGEAGLETDVALEVDVEHVPLHIPRAPATGFPAPQSGFQAFLQHANLHNLLQIESLSRTTGVFLVVSQGRRGYLHLSNGDLIHAEVGALTGEAAAAQILSWDDGEFKSCAHPLASEATIHSSLQALLLRLARDTDEAALSERRPPIAAYSVEEDKPTEPHFPAPNGDSARRPSSGPPRPSRMPPPLPPRIERDSTRSIERPDAEVASRESTAIAEVLISPAGDLVQGRGIGPDEFAARVAYAARLADLIGRAIRSGTPRVLELKGKGTHTSVKWQADGSLSASLELMQSPKMR